MKYRTLSRMVAVIAISAVFAGCANLYSEEKTEPAGTPSEITGESLKIGVLFPLSGAGAGYGTPAQRVLDIALKEINDAGGVNGKPLELVYEDGGCKPEQASVATNNLVSIKQVKVIIGGICSSETLTAAPIAEQNKVVLLSPGSSNPAITTAGDFVFRNYPSDLTQGSVLAEYAGAQKYKKVGALVEEQPYTEGIFDSFKINFEKTGGTTVAEKFASEASDFRTQITKLQALGVDSLFIDVQTPEKAELILKQIKEASVKGPFIMNDVAIGVPKETVEKYKDLMEGSVGTEVGYDKTDPDILKLQAVYKTQYNEEMPYIYLMIPVYDAVNIVKEATAQVGLDPVKIKDYLYTVKGRKGLAGELTFDANGDSNYRYSIRFMRNGVLEEK